METTGWPDYEKYCDVVEREAKKFADAVIGTDPGRAVPTCPGWTMADLTRHHGTAQRWFEYVVRHKSQQRVWAKDVQADVPGDPADYPAWFAAGVEPLVTTLRSIDPETPLWTNGIDQHARYWARRVLYEAVVHRADAELALGLESEIEPDLGTDGVDEFLTNVQCFPWVVEQLAELNREGETLYLRATDRAAQWLVTVTDGGFTWDHGHGRSDVAVQGTAGDLLLLVYGRFAPSSGRYEVTGDAQLLAEWLTHSAL